MQLKGRILYVEDHDDTRELMTMVLSSDDYGVTAESTVAGAIKLAQAEQFDLIMLDSWLADGSGIEFCHRIREFDPVTPILFYSGAVYESDKLEAIKAGAQGYLTKPCRFSDLLQTVANLIQPVSPRSMA